MTELTKPLTRVVQGPEGGRVVVELRPEGVNVRMSHQRVRYPTLGWGFLLRQAALLYEPPGPKPITRGKL